MIKVDKNEIHIKGSRPLLMTEITMLADKLHKHAGMTKETLYHAIDLAFMSGEELDNKVDEIMKDITPDVFMKMMQSMVNDLK